jgi:hypothetical protein
MIPALLKRMSSLFSLERKVWVEDLIVLRSARSRGRNSRTPVESENKVLMELIAENALDSERAAI